jgi:uncharacterized protein
MEIPLHHLAVPRDRLLHGKYGWWFLGPGGVARLGNQHLTQDGEVTQETRRWLSERGLFTVPQYRAYSLTVLTSTSCNLGCGYCFQNTGQDAVGGSRPPRIEHARLTSQTITAILDFVRSRMSEAHLDYLKVMLFGGEPLLNPRACRELLARAREYGMTHGSMITNGTLLTPRLAEQLSQLGLSTVQVTFDGDRDVHDHIRISRAGTPTFDTIVANVARVSQVTPLRWTLRINVSHHNQASIDALIARLADSLDPERCVLGLALVGDTGIGYGNELSHDDALLASFDRWQRHVIEAGFRIPRPRPHTPCQACSFRNGAYGAVVSADGSLSSCWETAGRPGWRVGDVISGYHPGREHRWTSCGAKYRYPEGRSRLAAFHDRADAALLDYLHESGRLTTPQLVASALR